MADVRFTMTAITEKAKFPRLDQIWWNWKDFFFQSHFLVLPQVPFKVEISTHIISISEVSVHHVVA